MADVEARDQQQHPADHKLISRFSPCTSTRMTEANKHIVPMPNWLSITGVARFVIAVLVLVFNAAATGIWGAYTAFVFTLFTACASLIIFLYYFIALCHKPVLYNRWAVLGLEIFGFVFWAVSFSLCAEWTAAANSHTWAYLSEETRYGFWNAPFDPEDIGLIGRDLLKRGISRGRAGIACAGVAAGLAGVEFMLFMITLVIFSMNLQKYRLAGNPAVYGGASTAPAPVAVQENTPAPVEKDEEIKPAGTTMQASTPQVLRKDSNSVL